MADRVHPKDSPTATSPVHGEEQPVSVHQTKHSPPPGTYVVNLPKDQIYRYPPPPTRHNNQKPTRRNHCCCCLYWLLSLFIILIVIIAASFGVFYLVYHPKAPKYSVDRLSIQGFNLTSADQLISPKMVVTVKARNPNKKIGIYYNKGSSISVSHSDDINPLCKGVLPVFHQPTNNVTVFQTVLTGSDTNLSAADYEAFRDQQKKGEIPLKLDLKVPVKIKVGSLKTWTISVKVRCQITVDKLAVDASILSNKCDVDVKPWE
ncbi:hypothetical protein IFM89_039556 [Coptis chinensis]|uniref:Late embryogenesis abundant protein LEA-2 subgroup domain-containing protein n=1 Tax=Coptis chinensis TaxID=261450 RepID=A0A835GUX5_9MAGN|nr:hypothetical protein IFM89_039556 [Coptis chinensis]